MFGHQRLPSTGRRVSPTQLPKRFTRLAVAAIGILLTSLFFLTHVAHWELPITSATGSKTWSLLPASEAAPGDKSPVYPFETTSAFYPVTHHDAATKSIQELCASFPNHLLQRIQPVLKMGHGEKREQILAQLNTVSACFDAQELLLFSDMDETILGRHAIDVLANLPEAYRIDNPDFEPYDTLQQMLDSPGAYDRSKDPTIGKNGWKLDKYKFLAEVERAWLMKPGRDWYVFYETDTYIVWDNMFRFLSTLDPAAPFYIGSPSPGREETWFANGGPGFVLSRGAMDKLLSRDRPLLEGPRSGSQFVAAPPLTLRGMDLVKGDCCGDSVLGWMLWEAKVPLSGFFPLFNTYPVHGIPYTERSWCQPVITMHKSTPEDMLALWRWEHRTRKLGRPLLYSDLFEFREITKPAVRQDWDNTNYDRLAPGRDIGGDSIEACEQHCDADPQCLQYMWRGKHAKQCVLMPFINFGGPKADETKTKQVNKTMDGEDGSDNGHGEVHVETVVEGFSFTSGWMVERIRTWRDEHECPFPEWLAPSTERHF